MEEQNKVKSVINTLYFKFKYKNISGLLSVIDENARFWGPNYNLKGKNQIRRAFNNTFALLDDFDYDLTYRNISIRRNVATVYVNYVLKYTIKRTGKRYRKRSRERFKLIKKNNSWYIIENQVVY